MDVASARVGRRKLSSALTEAAHADSRDNARLCVQNGSYQPMHTCIMYSKLDSSHGCADPGVYIKNSAMGWLSPASVNSTINNAIEIYDSAKQNTPATIIFAGVWL